MSTHCRKENTNAALLINSSTGPAEKQRGRMRFLYEQRQDWPPNAWLALCTQDSDAVLVYHGRQVETSDEWFCEAVWTGEFEAGGFDQADTVFGSGGRLRDGNLTFVSATSTVDRLQFTQDKDAVLVSNSLVCLVANSKIQLDRCYPDYYQDFRSVVKGIDLVKLDVRTTSGNLKLCYFHNLVWTGKEIEQQEKPFTEHDFSTFELYSEFMFSSVKALLDNGRSQSRKHPFEPLGTVSTGYDSPTVAVLAAASGCKEAITFEAARGGDNDSGEHIADRLGMNCTVISRDDWQQQDFPEVSFLAGDAYGEEMHYACAGEMLSGRMLLTGFTGGQVWNKQIKNLGPNIARSDNSGLALTEYRLWQGFIHCPVPYIGARQVSAINKISKSSAMESWDVPGNYNRPICRRMVEEEGVPREWFGQGKRATSVVLWNPDEVFLTEKSRADYNDSLNGLFWDFIKARRLHPTVRRYIRPVASALAWPLPPKVVKKRLPYLRKLTETDVDLFHNLFPWAVNRAVSKYKPSVRRQPRS